MYTYIFFFIIQLVKARAIPCPHQPPTNTYIYIYIHLYIYIYTYTHTRTHTHIYIYIYTQPVLPRINFPPASDMVAWCMLDNIFRRILRKELGKDYLPTTKIKVAKLNTISV